METSPSHVPAVAQPPSAGRRLAPGIYRHGMAPGLPLVAVLVVLSCLQGSQSRKRWIMVFVIANLVDNKMIIMIDGEFSWWIYPIIHHPLVWLKQNMVNYGEYMVNIISGWWFQPLWKIWKSLGMMISNLWKHKKMFQTTNQILINGEFMGVTQESRNGHRHPWPSMEVGMVIWEMIQGYANLKCTGYHLVTKCCSNHSGLHLHYRMSLDIYRCS